MKTQLCFKHTSTSAVFLVFFLLLQTTVFTQTEVPLIGNNFTISGASGVSPINISNRSTRMQMIYLASELVNANAPTGAILQLGFFIEEAPIYNLPDFSIKMKHTLAAEVETHDTGPFTEVYYNENYAPAEGDFDMLTLDVPFIWDGTSNILVEICFNLVQPVPHSSGQIRHYALPSLDGARHKRSDVQNMCATATTNKQFEKPQMMLLFAGTTGNDATVLSVDAPDHFCADMHEVVATIANFGNNTLEEVTVNWMFNGKVQPPIVYGNSLAAPGEGQIKAQLSLGEQKFLAGNNTIKVWTSAPNGGIDSVGINDTLQVVFSTGLSGTFGIGIAQPYHDFSDAVDALERFGVCGPVVFNVIPGTYTEQIRIPEIVGTNATNTITFQSITNNKADVILQTGSDIINNYTLQLDGADWCIFRNITIKALDEFYGNVLILQNGACHNHFERCLFEGIENISSSFHKVISSPNYEALDEYNVFKNNQLNFGKSGFYWQGSDEVALERGNVVENNIIENVDEYGIFFQYQNAIAVKNNTINVNSINIITTGIQLLQCDNQVEVIGNEIRGSANGIFLSDCVGTSETPVRVLNNFVQTAAGDLGEAIQGINSSLGTYHHIFHNTVNVQNTHSESAAISVTQNNKILKNNIFANFGGGYAITRGSLNGSNISQSDYNNLYTIGDYLGLLETPLETLTDWQNASSLDAHSWSFDPYFYEISDYLIAESSLNNVGIPLSEVTEDILGVPRNPLTPDIGAAEFDLSPVDAGLIALLPPQIPFDTGFQTIAVRIKNFGSTPLTSLTINWKHFNNLQPPVSWTGALASGETTVVTLGTVNMTPLVGHTISAWSSAPNGVTDPVDVNDFVLISDLYPGLSGTYTLGENTSDLLHFSEAAFYLHRGGVVGEVVINVVEKTYQEQVVFEEIPGASEINTITFQSEFGDSSLVVWRDSAINLQKNYTFQLDGAKWLRFKKMTFEAMSPIYGRVLDLRNGASHNIFEACVFRGVNSVNTSLDRAVIFANVSDSLSEYNVFRNNKILMGSYGIYWVGNDANSRIRGIVMDDNQIDSAFFRGIYLKYMDAPKVRSNTFFTASFNTNSSAIWIENSYNEIEILRNQISGFQLRGLYLSDCKGTQKASILVANNFIQVAGEQCAGIYNFNGSFQKFYHNSINAIGTTANTHAFLTASGNDIELLNNIFHNDGPGFAIFVSTTGTGTAAITRSDYNNLFTNGANLGNWTSSHTDLTAWQAASLMDEHSLSVDPFFVSSTDLHLTNLALDKKGTFSELVPTDIDGMNRAPNIPDIGADEILTDSLDAGVYTLVAPKMPFFKGAQNVWVQIINNDSTMLTAADIEWEVNGVAQTTYNWAGTLSATQISDSLNIGTFDFQEGLEYTVKVWTSNPNGATDSEFANDTMLVKSLYAALDGVYTIGGTNPDFINFTAAANALVMRGVSDAVTFNVRNGTYAEQISLPEVRGASENNTITFQSEGGDSTLVTLSYFANSTDNYTLRLDGIDWCILKNMTIEATNSFNGRVLELRNGATNNRVENCELRSVTIASVSLANAVIYSPHFNFLDEHNIFYNSLIVNGSHGFYLEGGSSFFVEAGNVIERCRIENTVHKGILAKNQNAIQIHKNTISTNTIFSNATAIQLYDAHNQVQLHKNHITGFNTGISLIDCEGTPDTHAEIFNNFVQTNAVFKTHSMSSSGGAYHDFFHNTVRQLSTHPNSAAFCLFANNFLDGNNKVALNNIFANEGGGYAISRQSQNDLTLSDYNNLFTTGPYIAYWNRNIVTLKDWQTFNASDDHSIDLNPFFSSPEGHGVAQISLKDSGFPLGNITEDIDCEFRVGNGDIGCNEFIPPVVDAGMTAILPPKVPFASGSQLIEATLKNYGLTDLTSATIEWTVNGIAQTAISWTGTLVSGDTAQVVLGMTNFSINQAHQIEAWTSQPNGISDLVMLNDTITKGGVYAALSGIYTLGGTSPDFNNFAEATENLKQGGILGTVRFEIRDGTYNEQVIIPEVLGANSNNTITFESESGDSSLVILEHLHATAAKNYTLLLDGTDWIRFEKLTLVALSNGLGRVVDLRHGATHNRFENCAFIGRDVNGGSIHAVIYSPDEDYLDNHNSFINNLILNGTYGFYMLGDEYNKLETGLVIENNRFENTSLEGIFLFHMENVLVHGNELRANISAFNSSGIQISTCYDNLIITANKIIGFQQYGIYLNHLEASANAPIIVANNFIQTQGTPTAYGIRAQAGAYQKIYHNSVHVENTGVPSYAFYTYRGTNKYIQNNIFANEGGGYAFYRFSTHGISTSEYNNIYTTGANIGYWEGDKTTLSDWQTASGLDFKSTAGNPFFVQADSFAVMQISLNDTANPIPQVTTDIQGQMRSTETPDIGCDEFVPPANDAGIFLVRPPQVPFASGNQLVKAVLRNLGTDTLKSATLHWAVNGVMQMPISWVGCIVTKDTLEVNLDVYNFPINQAHEIMAWTSLPNGVTDVLMFNDSSKVEEVYAGLAGTYKVGGSSPDFNTLTEAVTNLNFGGVLANVVFDVRSGLYNEQLRLMQTPGVSVSKTVTFTSELGDSSSVIITFDATEDENYTCQLDGADWIHFKKMTLEATNMTYGRVLDYRNDANNNRFLNCEFRGVNMPSQSDKLAVIHSPIDIALDDNNEFLNNYIRNGSYGFYINGGSELLTEKGIRLENNLVEDSYHRGILLLYAEAPVLHRNQVSSVSDNQFSEGIHLGFCKHDSKITKNQVFGFRHKGIFLNNCVALIDAPLIAANNFVALTGTMEGQGLYINNGTYQKVYYNTIEVTNTHLQSTAFRTMSGSNNDVINNIFTNTGGGYAFRADFSHGLNKCDHNDLYVTGANLGLWGFNPQVTLEAWVAASTFDINSVSIDPIYVSATDLHTTNILLDKVGVPVPEIQNDIDGTPRNPVLPDCGADEFLTAQNDAGVITIDSPKMLFAADIQPIYVTIINNGFSTMTALDLEWTVNGVEQPTFNWADTLLSAEVLDSVCIGSYLFELDTAYTISVWAANPNGMLDEDAVNDTATVENLFAALGGSYTIGGENPDFIGFTDAVNTLLKGGIIEEVTFNVRDGIYSEQVSISEIMGASSDHNIIFRSESGDSTAVKLTYGSASSDENYTLQLNGVNWVHFEKMTIENTSSSYARVVDIQNGASFNAFYNNEIIGSEVHTSFTSYALIYSGNSQETYNTFANNRLINGSYGFYYLGKDAATLEKGTEIIGNILEGQYVDGIHLFYQDAPLIESNQIINLANDSQNSFKGINCNYCQNEVRIVKNILNVARGRYGISLKNSTGTLSKSGLIANNFVELSNASASYGLWLENVLFQNTYHNTISINSTSPNSRALEVRGTNSDLHFINNIFAALGGGFAIYNTNGGPIATSDHNDLYTAGVNIAHWGGNNYTDLAAWQAFSNLDQNSLSIDPAFESAMDLHINEFTLHQVAIPIPNVLDDIDGQIRNLLSPTIGADEVIPILTNDVGIVDITHPNKLTPFAKGNQPVKIVIRNIGLDTIQSATIHWFVNDTLQVPYNWTGFLESGETDTLTIGTINFMLKMEYDILAFTNLPNNSADLNPTNDSILVEHLYAGLEGIYTLGGLVPDFNTFTEAAMVLNKGGMLGAVTFNVRNGTYTEQISLDEIRGASPMHLLTFQSESGDNNLVTLVNAINAPDYTLQLNGTDYLTFQNMTLEASSFSASAVIELGNNVLHTSFLNNRIIAPAFAEQSLIKSTGSGLNNNLVFQNNHFEGGKYGISLEGLNTGQLATDILIEGNNFELQRDRAMHLVYMDAPIIRANTISGAGSGNHFYGIFLRYCDNELEISKNKIAHSGDLGIYLDRCDGTLNNRGLVVNNFVHVEGTDLANGIYLTSCNFQNIYHNNVHITNTHLESRAFYLTAGSDNNLLNNIFANTGDGYALYIRESGASAGSNRNNLYATGNWLGHWAGTNASNLTALQLLSGKDENSISVDPLFISDTDLHVIQTALDSAGIVLIGIMEDIDGGIRDPNFPDIGADEVGFNNCSVNLDFPTGMVIDSGIYQAEETLTAAGTVSHLESVIFTAGSAIELLPGFQVDLGAVLDAFIGGCTALKVEEKE